MATPVRPAADEPTHGCVRCGAKIPIDESMCESCNPLGLKAPAASQAHGTAILGVAVAVVVLAVLRPPADRGRRPVQLVGRRGRPGSGWPRVSITVTNAGSSAGTDDLPHRGPVARRDRAPVGVRAEPRGAGRRLGDVRRRGRPCSGRRPWSSPRTAARDRRRRVRPRARGAGRADPAGALRAGRGDRPQVRAGRRHGGGPPLRGADPRGDPGALPGRRDPRRGVRRPPRVRRGEADATAVARAARPRPTWVVDPLDGTSTTRTASRTSACRWRSSWTAGRPSGVVHDPMRGETFWATADGPAMLDGDAPSTRRARTR